MHRKSLEAAEALKNDDSGGSDREDTASKASDNSSMHSPHSRSFSSNPLNGGNNNNNNINNISHNDRDNREQNNNKISLGNHNSSSSPSHNVGKEQMKSPYRGSPAPNAHGDLEKSSGHPPMNLHLQQLPPPPPTSSSAAALLNGKSVLSPPPPGLAAHHLHQHHHHSHPMPLHSHLMHPGLSPVSSTRTTPPPLPLSLSSSNGGGPQEVSPSSHSHLLAHHPNLPGLDPSKPPPPGAFHHESADPEAFRWVNYREPMSMIRWIKLQFNREVKGFPGGDEGTNWELFLSPCLLLETTQSRVSGRRHRSTRRESWTAAYYFKYAHWRACRVQRRAVPRTLHTLQPDLIPRTNDTRTTIPRSQSLDLSRIRTQPVRMWRYFDGLMGSNRRGRTSN